MKISKLTVDFYETPFGHTFYFDIALTEKYRKQLYNNKTAAWQKVKDSGYSKEAFKAYWPIFNLYYKKRSLFHKEVRLDWKKYFIWFMSKFNSTVNK